MARKLCVSFMKKNKSRCTILISKLLFLRCKPCFSSFIKCLRRRLSFSHFASVLLMFCGRKFAKGMSVSVMSSSRNLSELGDKLSENQTSEMICKLGIFQLVMAT